jgi:hypothetical protein
MVRRCQAEVDECCGTYYHARSTDAQLRLERLVFGSDYGRMAGPRSSRPTSSPASSSGPPRTDGAV